MKRNRTWFGIGACAGLATLLAAASSAWAQDEPPPADPESEATGAPSGEESVEAEGETIVVTGSRIRTDPLDKQAPVRQIGREELERTGLVSVGDILQQLPASGGAVNGKFNQSGNAGFPPDGGGVGAGAIEADLRYLGSKRVLVLVDGVRWVNGSSASGVSAATDLNTIPLAMIERIEVLEDGASPIYGSDAIGGVINIITRKDYDGVVANAYTGGYHHGDGITQKYDVSWGATNDRLSVVVGASFLDQQEVFSEDRELSDSAIPGLDNCEAGCSSATPNGRFIFVDQNAPPGPGAARDLTLDGGEFRDTTDTDRFNFGPYNLVLTPSRRLGVFSTMNYKIAEKFNFQGRASYTNRESLNQAAPEPLFIGPEGGNGNRVDRISIHETNPYNPFGFTFDPDTDSTYVISRRPLEAGPRRFEQVVNTFYAAGGFNGDFSVGKQRFFWDTTVAYGVNRATQRRNNSFNSAKLEQALGPAYQDSSGNWRCGTADNPGDPECVPFDLFGGQGPDNQGTITREMLDYTTFTQHDVSEQTLVDVVGNLSGEIVPLPAGPLAMALGVEHRRLDGFFEPDAIVAAGDGADVPAKPTEGDYWVNEAYAELRVPLVADVPGLELFDINGAVRVSDYSILEPEFTGKVGARWKPMEDLMLRGSYGRGFRAPGIGELYGNEARFDATLTDPCSDFNRAGVSQAVRDRCIALGVPANGGYTQLNPQISVTTGGNAELEPETSDSINVSLAYSPSALRNQAWVDRFDVEAAYYDIRIDGAIAPFDAQLQIDRCVVGGDDTLCDGISRTENGGINGFRNTLINLGGIETRGVDLALTYAMPPADVGRFRVSSISNLLIDFWEVIPTLDGEDVIEREGTVAGEPERAFPRFKSALVFDWFLEEVGASLTTRYVHKAIEPCRDLLDFPGTCSDPNPDDDSRSTNELKPKVYNDVQVIWIPAFADSALNITAGVNNVLNIEPPTCYSCSLNGFNATAYDVPGIFGYLSASYRLQ
jgi:iron complex outermembrane recepter protein